MSPQRDTMHGAGPAGPALVMRPRSRDVSRTDA